MRSTPVSKPVKQPLATLARAAAGSLGLTRWMGATMLIFVALQLVFLIGIVTVQLIPDKLIVRRLDAGIDTGLMTATEYIPDGIGTPTPDYPFAGVSDRFTECIALTLGIDGHAEPDRNPLKKAILAPMFGSCVPAVAAIRTLAAGQSIPDQTDYFRYWHGWQILTRPAIALFGLMGVRIVSGLVLFAGFLLAALSLGRHAGWFAPAAIIGMIFLSTNAIVQPAQSVSHAISLAFVGVSVALAAWAGRRGWHTTFIAAAVGGALYNYFDFLLNPPLAWSLTAFAAMAVAYRASPTRLSFPAKAGAGAALGWILGFGATWSFKWLLALLTVGTAAIGNIMNAVVYRLDGKDPKLVIEVFGAATRRNVGFWLHTIPTAPALLALSIALITVACVRLVMKKDWSGLAAFTLLSLPGLLIPLWFEALRNHSQVHTFFTYRAVPGGVAIAVAAAVLVAFRPRTQSTYNDQSTTRIDGSY